MYVLTISDDIGRRWETFVYDDNTDVVSIVNSFNTDILNSVVRLFLGRNTEVSLTEETYHSLSRVNIMIRRTTECLNS